MLSYLVGWKPDPREGELPPKLRMMANMISDRYSILGSDVAKGRSNVATRESRFALAWSFLACPTFHFEAKPALGQRR